MDEKMTININLADRSYRIKVNSDQEQAVRQTSQIVNEKVLEFKKLIPGKDMQDYIGMTLIWLACEQKVPGQQVDMQKWKEGLNKIENLLT